MKPVPAKALVTAGYRTLADLAGKFREDLTAIRGLGETSLAQCEELLGSALPSRTGDFAGHGIHPQIRRSLDRAGLRSLADLGKLTREQLLATPGFGEAGLRQCEQALGRPLDSPVETLQRQGLRPFAANLLATHGVRSVQDLAGRSDTQLKSLGLKAADVETIKQKSRKR
ncbi:MAG TPA: helix-hairpin-helix domain-containing protein [Thermoanaerobaculia bacterium]|nr:helix-hairpin-helix domain-containing protein [Thermoanaerobaculia bacterium]